MFKGEGEDEILNRKRGRNHQKTGDIIFDGSNLSAVRFLRDFTVHSEGSRMKIYENNLEIAKGRIGGEQNLVKKTPEMRRRYKIRRGVVFQKRKQNKTMAYTRAGGELNLLCPIC